MYFFIKYFILFLANVSSVQSSPSRTIQRKITGIDHLVEAATLGATAALHSKSELKSQDKTSLVDSSDSEDLSVVSFFLL